MLILLLHGLAGGFDELIIAVVAIGVLWLAVKLAGRKPAEAEQEEEEQEVAAAEEQSDPAAPTR
jgi:hypothetical protein